MLGGRHLGWVGMRRQTEQEHKEQVHTFIQNFPLRSTVPRQQIQPYSKAAIHSTGSRYVRAIRKDVT